MSAWIESSLSLSVISSLADTIVPSLSALCGFGNLASGGINIGILTALAPNRGADIVRITPRALATGIIATLSTACVAGESISNGVGGEST